MLQVDRLGLGAQFELAGGFGLGNFRVEGRPLRSHLAALEAEPQLHALGPAGTGAAVDRHMAGTAMLVPKLLCTVVHHLEIVVARQARNIVGTGDAHLVLGPGIERLELRQGQRPVDQIGTVDIAVDLPGPEFMFLQPQAGAGPVRGGAANRLADPGR